MTFQSLKYILFFLCSVISIFSVRGKYQNIILLLFNLLFVYFVGGLLTISFLCISTLSTFVAGMMIQKSYEQRKKKIFLILPFLMNLSFLFVLKYSAFFTSTANAISLLFHLRKHFNYLNILAPVGISFYTLWMFGYLLDIYWTSINAEKDIIKFAVFATYFPIIISGPIVRYQNMREQFSRERILKEENVSRGILRICWGFFEKMVIADNIAKIVNLIYNDYSNYSGIYILIATFFFAIQLYTDFCGCIDIALGCSTILGINLPENFDAPFFSKSIAEFWRRWHISLGSWFKDYFMYPILKSDCFVNLGIRIKSKFGKHASKKIPVYIAMVLLWFTIGFWHGGLWKYIIGSGILHCFYMIFSDLMGDVYIKTKSFLHINESTLWWKIFQIIRTFLLVCIGFVFFRSDNLYQAFDIFNHFFFCKKSLIEFSQFLGLLKQISGGTISSLIRTVSSIIFIPFLFFVPSFRLNIEKYSQKQTVFISVVLVFLIYVFSSVGNPMFIYFNF